MELFVVPLKNYKRNFTQVVLLNVLFILSSFTLVKSGYQLLSMFDPGKQFTNPVLLGMVLIGFVHSNYQKNQLRKLKAIEDFDEKLIQHERFYKTRIMWFLFTCLISCFLFVLTGRYLFFYFSLFDLLVSFGGFPRKEIIKKELDKEDIIFQ